MESYKGKKIWIIGASSGIGLALAKELHSHNASLILSARSKEKLNDLNNELGEKHVVLPLDVQDHKVMETAAQSIDKIDSIIYLAAIYDPAPCADLDIQSVHNLIDINLKGAFNLITVALPLLNAQGQGQLALCGSVAGYRGLPNGQPYSATKAAVINLAESLKLEEPQLDIKVINPGFVRTSLTDKNDFKMPMIIEPEKAAKIIRKELLSRKFEIHFPKKFTIIMKILQILPYPLYFWIAGKIRR